MIEAALEDYKADLGSFDARIQMRLSFPMQLVGAALGAFGLAVLRHRAGARRDRRGSGRRIVHLDYVYSSTCPCSLELAEHARMTVRGQLATPHSQRSVARISVEVKPGVSLWFEDLIELARKAVVTETQVMVKREDEQAFRRAERRQPDLRRGCSAGCSAKRCGPIARIGDFRVIASHQESLHSHDAISLLTEGETFAAESLDPRLFRQPDPHWLDGQRD